MLTQKIIGTEYKKVKYHGSVKFLIFECNFCSKRFSKMESYCKKQLKIHKNACCFCSPGCRNKFFNKNITSGRSSEAGTKKSSGNSHTKNTVISWLNKLFNG